MAQPWSPPSTDITVSGPSRVSQKRTTWTPPSADSTVASQKLSAAQIGDVMRQRYPQAFADENVPTTGSEMAKKQAMDAAAEAGTTLWNMPGQTLHALTHPVETLQNIRKASQQELERARQEAQQAQAAGQTGSALAAAGRGLIGQVPIVGPMALDIWRTAESGQPGKAAGEILGLYAGKELAPKVGEAGKATYGAVTSPGALDIAKGGAKISTGVGAAGAGLAFHGPFGPLGDVAAEEILGKPLGISPTQLIKKGITDIKRGVAKNRAARASQTAATQQPSTPAPTPTPTPVAAPAATATPVAPPIPAATATTPAAVPIIPSSGTYNPAAIISQGATSTGAMPIQLPPGMQRAAQVASQAPEAAMTAATEAALPEAIAAQQPVIPQAPVPPAVPPVPAAMAAPEIAAPKTVVTNTGEQVVPGTPINSVEAATPITGQKQLTLEGGVQTAARESVPAGSTAPAPEETAPTAARTTATPSAVISDVELIPTKEPMQYLREQTTLGLPGEVYESASQGVKADALANALYKRGYTADTLKALTPDELEYVSNLANKDAIADYAAKLQGAQIAYDVGIQRTCWQIHSLTNWMGDAGRLLALTDQYRAHVYLSDVVRLGGRVDAKEIDADGNHVVRLVTWAHNQRGQNVMPGTAVVQLPHRPSAK